MKSVIPSLYSEDESSDNHDGAFLRTLRFAYRHSATLIAISIAWILLSLPLITVGPVTLGAYCVIISLRETGEVNLDHVRATVRSNFGSSLLFGLVPIVFGGIGLLYLVSPPRWAGGTVSIAFGVAASYLGLYFAVLLVPTFHAMACGGRPIQSLRTGYFYTAGDPIAAVRLVGVTIVLFVVAILLTIAVVIIYPAFVMSYHVHATEQKLVEMSDQ